MFNKSLYFVLVVELLSINIIDDPKLKGVSIIRERHISQLADATALFLRDKKQCRILFF